MTTAKDTPKLNHNNNIPTIKLDREATAQETNPKLTNARLNNIPFTIEELERAMTKATMKRGEGTSVHRESVAVC